MKCEQSHIRWGQQEQNSCCGTVASFAHWPGRNAPCLPSARADPNRSSRAITKPLIDSYELSSSTKSGQSPHHVASFPHAFSFLTLYSTLSPTRLGTRSPGLRLHHTGNSGSRSSGATSVRAGAAAQSSCRPALPSRTPMLGVECEQ